MLLSKVIVVALSCAFLLGAAPLAYGQLSPTFYDEKCPNVTSIIREIITDTLSFDPRIAASLIRLHFHDCFVNGCDASILLDNSDDIESEKQAAPNNNSVRGFDVIDRMKARLESECPGVVSCADILTVAAEESVVLAGGPSWAVPLGRRDRRTANQSAVVDFLPSPFETLDQIKSKFSALGLNNNTDLVALSGAHTFGRSQCQFFTNRMYNLTDCSTNPQPDGTLNSTYLQKLIELCPCNGNGSVLVDLDPTTPDGFDSNYYSNLQIGQGLLGSDQKLFSTSGADTVDIVNSFSANQTAFFESFLVDLPAYSPINGVSLNQASGSFTFHIIFLTLLKTVL
ncbi:unnamed protein product [Dovyalis caffra]|uniref:Peroxidase n=1 Tax=Dovyalis caffra TaxID=77055 RepID=A0AAV1RT18_9ROSI|nr:unnamed protein product [Dovyalis caffra]